MMVGGKHIAMEAKHNDKVKTSMPIAPPKKKGKKAGDGLQYHQLEALAAVANNGGIARVVWRNGGLVMAIGNAEIIIVHKYYNEGGRKSIPRSLFTVCEQRISNGCPYTSWLNADEAIEEDIDESN
jgi:hypothetical protein